MLPGMDQYDPPPSPGMVSTPIPHIRKSTRNRQLPTWLQDFVIPLQSTVSFAH